MAPSRRTRRSRRLSHKSPMELADYDWQAASLQPLHSGSDAEVTPSTTTLSLPSPSSCTSVSSDSPPIALTHLPFPPGSSHTRNRKDNHVPRPPNAFMLFRSWLWKRDDLKSIERDNRNVSRIAGRYWNELSEAERAPFHALAQEVKTLHAKINPDYRYSPGSQKKQKASQRRSKRNTDTQAQVEKCKRIADLLLEGAAASRDLEKYLVDDRKKAKAEQVASFVPAAEEGSGNVVPPTVRKKRSAAPRRESPVQPRSKKARTVPTHPTFAPPPHYTAPPPIPFVAEARSVTTAPSICTPELTYPPGDVEEFIPTDDIPHLSLDNCDGMVFLDDHDLSALFPPHMDPGAHSVFGVKSVSTEFVDSCIPYNAEVLDLPSVFPSAGFDLEPYPSLVPLGSPVFTNPFEPSMPTKQIALLDTLDQLFGQPISPLTPIFPY